MRWTNEKTNYLMENWGENSIPYLARKLKTTETSIMNKANRLGLGAFLENGEYITVNQFFKAIGRTGCWTYTLTHWVKKGFPLKYKKVKDGEFKVIYLRDFWKWAKEYRMHIDFAKFKENALGKEPKWVKEQRKVDIAFAKYKTTIWTKKEDGLLESLLKSYRYTYRELSLKLLRTEGAIKRRINDLNIKNWPISQPQHSIWTKEQEEMVIDMYEKGYRSTVISEYIPKSEMAINGKIERLIKEGKLKKWK